MTEAVLRHLVVLLDIAVGVNIPYIPSNYKKFKFHDFFPLWVENVYEAELDS